MTRWAVVLAGGVGSRFWPLSTPIRPKQLLPLVDNRPLLVAALDRLAPLVPAAQTLVLTNASLRDLVRTHLPSIPADNIIAEPRAVGTGGALAWAASEIQRRAGDDAVMLSVHADWAVADDDGFRAALARAADIAQKESALVTVGVVPTRPDTGFGYILPGKKIASDAHRVERFVEKPDRANAARMIGEGALWNSGIFAWCVGDFLAEIHALTPELAPALDAAGTDSNRFFALATPVTVDVGVLERSTKVVVIPGSFGWDDVGTWASLARVRQQDERGNAASGPVVLIEADDNVVHAEGTDVVLYGVADLVVVAQNGLTLVTTKEHSADLKALIAQLPARLKDGG
ncbi:MAG TPA: mannose-1-phosphate guanylyltransferase [Gemmatimonadaceae bacterium]|nr:mannose-1-phosphate guanylyltransferase [Gemmatimonadaceae bacterium]